MSEKKLVLTVRGVDPNERVTHANAVVIHECEPNQCWNRTYYHIPASFRIQERLQTRNKRAALFDLIILLRSTHDKTIPSAETMDGHYEWFIDVQPDSIHLILSKLRSLEQHIDLVKQLYSETFVTFPKVVCAMRYMNEKHLRFIIPRIVWSREQHKQHK